MLGGGPDAALDVVLEDEDRQGIHCGAQGRGLLEDVDAVLLTLDHPGDATDLALDPGKAADELGLVLGVAVTEGGGRRVERRVVVAGGHPGSDLLGAGSPVALSVDDTPWGYPGQVGRLGAAQPLDPLHSRWMDPRDLLRAFPDGIACTVCDQPVPAARLRLLAYREDMTFVQVECAACRSTSLGFLAGSASPAAEPVTSDDVIAMHEFLAGWDGDARALVADPGTPATPSERSLPPR